MNNKTKEIIAIYLISVYIAGLAYIGLRRAYVVENSIKIYFIFVLGGILIGTVITALNTWYKRYITNHDIVRNNNEEKTPE